MAEKKHNLVYKTTNIINGKIYIGVHCTDDLEDGYIGSGIYNQEDTIYNTVFHRAVRKHGYKNFKRDILYEFGSAELAYWWESYLVDEDFIKRVDTYNMQTGGRGGSSGRILSDETLKKLSKRFLGRKQSKEHIQKKADARRGKSNSLKGKIGRAYAKKVQDTLTGIIYSSPVEASKTLKLSYATVYNSARNINKNKRWKYV